MFYLLTYLYINIFVIDPKIDTKTYILYYIKIKVVLKDIAQFQTIGVFYLSKQDYL